MMLFDGNLLHLSASHCLRKNNGFCSTTFSHNYFMIYASSLTYFPDFYFFFCLGIRYKLPKHVSFVLVMQLHSKGSISGVMCQCVSLNCYFNWDYERGFIFQLKLKIVLEKFLEKIVIDSFHFELDDIRPVRTRKTQKFCI